MSRNVVTLSPRLLVLPTKRNRERRARILAQLGERYRLRPGVHGSSQIDFPKRLGGSAAKDEVSAELDRLDSRWRRLFVLYPTEESLRRPK
jgi:hypothetical protein